MRPALIKLESFAAMDAGSRSEPAFSQHSLDQAYADGMAEGLVRREDEQLRTLAAGIGRLSDALAEDDVRRVALRREAVDALLPLLTEILDALTPSATSQRLERCLTEELIRLSQSAAPVRAKILCSEDQRAMVENCMGSNGGRGIEIETRATSGISLSLQGGRIEFSQEDVARQIRALIAEAKGEETTWTH